MKLETKLWHNNKCYINMKYNTRYFYTIFGTIIGIWSLKYFYFYIFGKRELDFEYQDYASIGGLSGIFLTNFFLPLTLKTILISASIGAFYGLTYNSIMIYTINKNKRNAEKLGIEF